MPTEGEVDLLATVQKRAKGTGRGLGNLIYEKMLKEFHLFSLGMTFSLLRFKSCYIKKRDGHRSFFSSPGVVQVAVNLLGEMRFKV